LDIVKKYKQYFTPLDLAEFMVRIVPDCNIKTVIDLSMGECGLLEAAKKRWKNAEFYGVDIDENLLKKIHNKSPYIHIFNGDGLGKELQNWGVYQNILCGSKFDLAIANPPFDFYDRKIVNIDNTGFSLPIEIRFLLKYLEIVKEGGYICIILPYGFLSLDLYKEFRKSLLNKAVIHKVIKIFEGCFEGICADTCLLLLQKKFSFKMYMQESISIEYLDNEYTLFKNTSIMINDNVENRLDLEYQNLLQKLDFIKERCKYPIQILSEYVTNCQRGKTLAGKKELTTDKGIRFLHTTDVKYLEISNKQPTYVSRTNDYFKKIDIAPLSILIGRVGKACIGKVAIIPEWYSKTVISDCLFCLETEGIDPYYLTLYLATSFGQMQLKGLAKGSCSKYITKKDLLTVWIIVPDVDIQIYFREKYLKLMKKREGAKKSLLLRQLVSEVEKFLEKE